MSGSETGSEDVGGRGSSAAGGAGGAGNGGNAGGGGGGGGGDLASRTLVLESKRFYLDVKENARGRFIKMAEISSDGRKNQILMTIPQLYKNVARSTYSFKHRHLTIVHYENPNCI